MDWLTWQDKRSRGDTGFGLENIFTGIGRKRVWGVGFGESWEKFRSPALETTDLKILWDPNAKWKKEKKNPRGDAEECVEHKSWAQISGSKNRKELYSLIILKLWVILFGFHLYILSVIFVFFYTYNHIFLLCYSLWLSAMQFNLYLLNKITCKYCKDWYRCFWLLVYEWMNEWLLSLGIAFVYTEIMISLGF